MPALEDYFRYFPIQVRAVTTVSTDFSIAYPDTDTASMGPIALTQEWKEYTIDLTGMDLSYIIGGFCWVVSAMDNPEGMVFYLDDIIYE